MIEVVDPGPLATVQDHGRPGLAHLGVSGSGAADRRALDRGNSLVGNAAGAAALECTLAGPRLRFLAPAVVALTGVEERGPFEAKAGDQLDIGSYARGVRLYVCVRGGIDVEPVLGSRSADLMSGIGPPPVRAGDVLRIGNQTGAPAEPEPYGIPAEPRLRVSPGPRADWFVAGALGALAASQWRVRPDSNRVGIRLDGPPLRWAREGELESEGVVAGALQVPPSGLPILLGADHPTTGGYPVLAVVAADDLWLAGQLRPGDIVRFAARDFSC
ncbi:MAG TPA: biotin-dependent carboxyltransferase family protein [Gaiellaceae bacterium]|nr:biotin-dependent carboxyltransferase family protein [Gaiellaceae bacterium]